MKAVRKVLLAAGIFAFALVGISDQAKAGSTTANLNVSATIGASCSISSSGSPAAFTYDPVGANASTAYTATSTITYACTSGSTPTGFTLDQGLNPTAGSTAAAPARQMVNGTNKLAYNIFSSTANQTTGTAAVAWGTANEPTLTAGTGSNQNLTLYYKIPAGQNTLPSGTYSDTVVETLSF